MTGVEQLILASILVLVIGGIAGFLGGFFGMGGGIVLVPTFLALFTWLSHGSSGAIKEAIGTSLILVIPTGLGAVRRQRALGNLDVGFCKSWLPYTAFGAIIGAALSLLFGGIVLKIIFLAYLIVCIIVLLVLRDQKPGGRGGPRGWPARFAATVIGAFSTMLGIGGGTLVVPYLRLHRIGMKRALGVSSATTIAIGAMGSIGMIIVGWGAPGRLPYSLGYISIVAAVLIAPLMYWMSPLGVSAAHKLSKAWLKAYYVIFLMVAFAFMLWHTVQHAFYA